MEKRSAALGAVGTLAVLAAAFGGISLANAQNAPAPASVSIVTTEAPAPAQEPVVTTPAPEPTTKASAPAAAEPAPAPVVAEPAPVVVEPTPVYVAHEPVAPAPAPVYVAPAPVAPAPAPAPAGEYNQVQLAPVNGTSATAYSTDPNSPVNAPAMPNGNGKRG